MMLHSLRLIEFTVSKNTKHKGRYRLCEEDQVWVDGSEVDSELPPWSLLNDDNDENRSEGYGSVRRRLVKKAKRVDSFDVEAMAFVGYHVGSENSGGELNFDISRDMLKGETKANDGCGNKVMVAIDLNMESKSALHWALDDTVQNQDTKIR
ncbi:hypothetical protein Tco_0612209 [Tanacetum coccineum]